MSDFISRQAAIDALKDVSEHYTDKGREWHPHVDFMVEAIQDLPSAQQWIPVSERLPIPNSVYEDVFVYYLVQNEYGDMMVATFVQFPGGARVWQQMYQDGAIMEDIVAWMPLPECYKGES